MDRPEFELEWIRRLSTYRFDGKTEQAIREEWIQDLLRLLGYGPNTLNQIEYGETLRLARNKRMIGSRQVEVDYLPTVRGRNLWVIEAKAPQVGDREARLGQAWCYATHPEVNVPFIVFADGTAISVHDLSAVDWYEPSLELTSSELVPRFDELDGLIGAANVARVVRSRVLGWLESALSTEIDFGALDAALAEVNQVVQRSRSAVLTNQRTIVDDQARISAERIARIDAEQGVAGVTTECNVPIPPRRVDLTRAIALVPSDDLCRRDEAIRRMMQVTEVGGVARPFWPVRALQLVVALETRIATPDDYATRVARERIREALLDFPDDPVARAAHTLERVLPVALARSFTSATGVDFSQAVANLGRIAGTEWVLRNPHDPHRLALSQVLASASRVWHDFTPWAADDLDRAARALTAIADTTQYDEAFLRQYVGFSFVGDEWKRDDQLSQHAAIFVDEYDGADLLDDECLAALGGLVGAGGKTGEAAQRILAGR